MHLKLRGLSVGRVLDFKWSFYGQFAVREAGHNQLAVCLKGKDG